MARSVKTIKAKQKPSTKRKRKFQAEVLGYSIGIYIDKVVSISDIAKQIIIELPDIDLGL